jgi:hypothetical protein
LAVSVFHFTRIRHLLHLKIQIGLEPLKKSLPLLFCYQVIYGAVLKPSENHPETIEFQTGKRSGILWEETVTLLGESKQYLAQSRFISRDGPDR